VQLLVSAGQPGQVGAAGGHWLSEQRTADVACGHRQPHADGAADTRCGRVHADIAAAVPGRTAGSGAVHRPHGRPQGAWTVGPRVRRLLGFVGGRPGPRCRVGRLLLVAGHVTADSWVLLVGAKAGTHRVLVGHAHRGPRLVGGGGDGVRVGPGGIAAWARLLGIAADHAGVAGRLLVVWPAVKVWRVGLYLDLLSVDPGLTCGAPAKHPSGRAAVPASAVRAGGHGAVLVRRPRRGPIAERSSRFVQVPLAGWEGGVRAVCFPLPPAA
jgi:hypothetical protein